MADKKIIKNISLEEWSIMAYVVGTPPANSRAIGPALGKARDLLFETILDNASDITGMAPVFPPELNGIGFVLKNSDWNTLKDCFESAPYPDMLKRRLAKILQEKVIEADDYQGEK